METKPLGIFIVLTLILAALCAVLLYVVLGSAENEGGTLLNFILAVLPNLFVIFVSIAVGYMLRFYVEKKFGEGKLTDEQIRDIEGHLRNLSESSLTIIEGSLQRTKRIIDDLNKLKESSNDLSGKTVWCSSFLSSFAIGERDTVVGGRARSGQHFLDEKASLLDLAEQDCSIRCIITPVVDPSNFRPKQIPTAFQRATYLLHFLGSTHSALRNIEWVVSPRPLKHLYIIDGISCIEGFEVVKAGFEYTLVDTRKHTIEKYTEFYEDLFKTLVPTPKLDYERPPVPVRQHTIEQLTTSVKFLVEQIVEQIERGEDLTFEDLTITEEAEEVLQKINTPEARKILEIHRRNEGSEQ